MIVNAHPAVQVQVTKATKNVDSTNNDLEGAESSYGNLNWGHALGNFGGFGHGLGSFGGLGSGIFRGGFGGFGRIFGGHGFLG
ncbi:unnamed protein product [Diamesa serratosioi]